MSLLNTAMENLSFHKRVTKQLLVFHERFFFRRAS